ncbi:N-acetylmuramoyl-L-alanine amidase [Alteribacillus persepolensis]|uniref:N-acetylmuramoyl-L-alanine amidase n=1 Tax=Alteribacillus persepolensis TaxID=568899 RepID=A0A1G8ACS4_9BACI|nr:N-acetylmuramoyl-L-alanine amidase [Alteribacillus persepolensis]SDH18699.1 N-acetylmuramoyl-L-alanine amidase [Alteribacillus persepolensis]
MLKKVSYVLLALSLLLSIVPSIGLSEAKANGGYSDVGSGHWAYDEIMYLKDKRVATGDETGRFRTTESLSRAQASVMMTNALNAGVLNSSSPSFSDVNKGFWAYGYIERAAEMGFFQGRNGEFNPNDKISKAQVAAIVARAFFGQESQHNNQSLQYSDISESFWANGYIATLVENNIIEDTGAFEPNTSATRAEFAVILARAMNENLRIGQQPDNGGNVDETPGEKPAEDDVLYEGVVRASTPLNVRSGPGMEHSVIDTLSNGTSIDVYEMEGDWLKVYVDSRQGYVYHSYVDKADGVGSDDGQKPAEPISKGKVTASKLMVRSGPSASYDSIGSLSAGEVVDIYEQTNGSWVLIKYNGDWAYTHSGYMKEKGIGESVLNGKTIVIDAGHGGHDPGAQANGLVEKNVVLSVALSVEDLLENDGVNVVMTRDDDTFVSLSGRVNIAERANADSFVSIHANAATPAAEGAETFYDSSHQAKESRELASAIQDRLVKDTGMSYRRVANTGFYVIKNTTMPSTLIELGFLTNSRDAQRMKQAGYTDKAARAVYNGIKDYYEW